MRFLELKNKLGDQLVFTSNDIKKIEEDFDYRRLTEWQKKGYIKKIKKGYYIFADKDLSEEGLFVVANKIYNPSYVSLQSALRYYNLIPEGVFTVTSVSTRKTQRFDSDIGSFNYRNLKKSLFFGYDIIGTGPSKAKIATPEKAIVDYFYLNSGYDSKESVAELRIDKDSFTEKVDVGELESILNKIGSDNLQRRVELLLDHLNHV